MHGTRVLSGKMLIGGKLVDGVDGQWLESINPADETTLGRVPLGSARDMNLAVDAALAAFPAWAALSMEKRAEYIYRRHPGPE
jgi:betaine-aldehyde dehydrogenase